MTEQELNRAADRYLKGDAEFGEVYGPFTKLHGNYELLATVHGLDKHDIQAGYEDTLLNVLDKYDSTKGVFSNYLGRSLRNKLTDLLREVTGRYREETCYSTLPGDPDEPTIFYKLPDESDEANVEREVIRKEMSGKQGTLTADLVNAANVDGNMRDILRGIGAGKSVHSAAKHYETCHKTVRRRLDKIASMYDPVQYGDIHDYFTA